MNLESLIGQTLDEKYRIERELGRGGMGAVYLATHVGTERHVALKVIVPQFMERAEFVERFRREARAAGRLRHPNVVDVTDFGFADMPGGRVAYLVMEYLDGCTLGEILEEEKHLPLEWTLDILEQVGSAIQEAHLQGIIHRDLKPDNIWLEPNQRGGYTVKVLDFGIAKLENAPDEHSDGADYQPNVLPAPNAPSTRAFRQRQTISDGENPSTVLENSAATASEGRRTIAESGRSKTFTAEAGTLIQPLAAIDSESGTAILPAARAQTAEQSSEAGTRLIPEMLEAGTQLVSEPLEVGTKLISQAENTENSAAAKRKTSELTRVGAVLGTPLYMSPEQCRGEHLTAQSDIYSLGVIAYQMLAGKTPFTGDYLDVMRAHQETLPPRLEAKKVPRKVKRVIASALEKNPADRPPTVDAFASILRAHSEGIGVLLRRALTIYGEHLPKFLGLSILLYLPFAAATVLKVTFDALYGAEVIGASSYRWIKPAMLLLTTFVGIFSGYLLFGTTTWLVAQILAVPLRPVVLRPALKVVSRRWTALATTGMISGLLSVVGFLFCFVPGAVLSVVWALVAPVVVMENLRGRAALRRSKTLVRRSLSTTVAAITLMYIVPLFLASLISIFVATTIKSFSDFDQPTTAQPAREQANAPQTAANNKQTEIQITIGNENVLKVDDGEKAKKDKPRIGGINGVLHDIITTILTLPLQILIASLSSIIVGLLYLKTRRAGGESLQDLLAQFEDADQPRKDWQRRVRERLMQSSRSTSRPQSAKNDKRTTGDAQSET